MREKAKSAETKFFTSKGGKNMNPSDFKEGKTLIRVAPSHNTEKDPPFVPFRSTYLEVELEIEQMSRYHMTKLISERKLEGKFNVTKVEELGEGWDDDKLKAMLKKLLGESFTMKVNKRVFTSNLHGKEGSKDLIDEYIKFVVNKNSTEIGDKDELRKANSPLFGYKDKQGKWYPGINPSLSYVFYGWDWSDSQKPFYKIEVYGGMMNRIEELYTKFDSEGEPLVIDPFSDANEGVGIQFDKYKNDKGKWDFRIEDAVFNGKRQTWKDFVEGFKLEEAQLKQLAEAEPLQIQFGRGSFKTKDFKVQLSGLVLFDEKHKYNAFENEEFLSIVSELSDQYSEEDEADQEKEVEQKKVAEVKSGKDIDKMFSKKPLKIEKKPVKEPEPVVEDNEENNGDEDSFREEQTEPEKEQVETKAKTGMSLEEKLAMLRKNSKK